MKPVTAAAVAGFTAFGGGGRASTGGVDGPCILYKVTADRITHSTVCTFPDKVGDVLD